MASVRFICGTQSVHKELEAALAAFLGTDDSILYSSCFDANGGLFETLLGEEDAVISDELNHASIVDGIRLCKAKRYRYRNNDMADLAAKLARGGRRRRALQADRDRRRVLDGRHHRQPAVDLRPGRPARRAGDGRRFARGRLRRRARPRHARASAASRAASTSSPARWARRWAARRAAIRARRGAKSSSCCASVRARTSSRTRWRPRIAAASLEVLEAAARATRARSCARRVRENGERFRARDDGAGLRPRARAASDHPGDAGRRGARDAHGRRAARRRHLRDRLFVSGRAEGQGAHPHADERGAHAGADRPRGRGVRQGRQARSSAIS